MLGKYLLAIKALATIGKWTVIEKKIYEYYKTRLARNSNSSDVILVQCPEDPYYFALFGMIVLSVKKTIPVRAEQYHLHSLRPAEFLSVKAYIFKRITHLILNIKWQRLYTAFCDGKGYGSSDLEFPYRYFSDLYKSYSIWRNLKSKDELISLKINGLPVGDLINDTYIRWKPAPTVCLTDPYLWRVIRQTLKDIRLAKNYFTDVKPKIFLTSHCNGYIQHGIAARIALQSNVKVYAFGNRQEFTKELSLNNWVAAKNPDQYQSDFTLLADQESKLLEADAALSSRLSGSIDRATSYMKSSAYLTSDISVPDVSGAVIVFLHCFYDCPHGYRHTVFPDFWEWISFTIQALEKANIKYFIKPHPSWMKESAEVYNRLLECYPNVPRISPKITNKQLADAGISYAVSVHGTVTHELAYLGVPTVSCGDNPHVSFNFCKTTKTRYEYEQTLVNFRKIKFDKDQLRMGSLIFFYMHNLNLSKDDHVLLNALSEFSNMCNQDFQNMQLNEISKKMDGISELPSFKSFINKIVEILN
jgi:hypothetical protein